MTNIQLDDQEIEFLHLINTYRSQNNAPTLQISPSLTQAADWMSTDMSTKNYFSHTDSTGRNPFTRMDDFGYRHNTWRGENLAAGHPTAQEAFNGWLNACDPQDPNQPIVDCSQVDCTNLGCTFGHRENMRNPNYRVIGISRHYDANSQYKWYWTTDFGGVIDSTINPTPGTVSVPQSNLQTQSGPRFNPWLIIFLVGLLILLLLFIFFFLKR